MQINQPFNVTVIPASLDISSISNGHIRKKKKRVAAYARVSTDDEEQQTSYRNQTSYYTEYIQSNPDWEFVRVYTDEGVTGTNTKKREGFKAMVADALADKIDLIITKSVSRFARNTVDSLTTIRKLKEHGIEVYFEKENIYTLDSKGEFLITIMSSIAQEESRSISENVIWGKRKAFRDGKVSLAYKRFLGLKKGENGRPAIDQEQAQIVRKIFRMFLLGCAPLAIATHLTEEGIPTPTGKSKWSAQVIINILSNEKYKGDAILQKTFTVSYLTHEKKVNEGEVPQYYVKNSHEAIIDPEIFDIVQYELKFWRESSRIMTSKYPFSSKLRCATCGEYFISRVLHTNSKYTKRVWQCRSRSLKGKSCISTGFDSTELEHAFLTAVNQVVNGKDDLVEVIQEFADEEYATAPLEEHLAALEEEIILLYNTLKSFIEDNAQTPCDQDDYRRKYDKYAARFEAVKQERLQVSEELTKLRAQRLRVEHFIRTIEQQDVLVTQFDAELWYSTVDWMEVTRDQDIDVVFKGGYTVRVPMPHKHTRKKAV